MSIAFEKVHRKFLDSLEKRGLTLDSIRNYKYDLNVFKEYLQKTNLKFNQVNVEDMNHYIHELSHVRKLKPNSVRRKIMTVKAFYRFYSIAVDRPFAPSEKVIPPKRIEKPPGIIPHELILQILADQDQDSWGLRNQALVYLLYETGARIQEVLSLKKNQVRRVGKQIVLSFESDQSSRTQRIKKPDFFDAYLNSMKSSQTYMFHSYNRAGPQPERLTSRGVELLFKAWSKRYKMPHLRPRALRQMYILRRLFLGISIQEIQKDLGLRSTYSFQWYQPLLKDLQVRKLVFEIISIKE